MTDLITGRLEQAAWLMAEIDHRRDHWTARRHPLYERWAQGQLSDGELQLYAAEHHHVVVALAEVADRAAARAEGLLREALVDHARERDADVERWCRFAMATGWGPGSAWYYAADPAPETEAAVAEWVGGAARPLAEHLVTVYALEAAQADVARPALDGLLGRRGFTAADATRYFELRLDGGEGPAAVVEAALGGLLPVADPYALLRRAERTLRAYWDLLDGVVRGFAALR